MLRSLRSTRTATQTSTLPVTPASTSVSSSNTSQRHCFTTTGISVPAIDDWSHHHHHHHHHFLLLLLLLLPPPPPFPPIPLSFPLPHFPLTVVVVVVVVDVVIFVVVSAGISVPVDSVWSPSSSGTNIVLPSVVVVTISNPKVSTSHSYRCCRRVICKSENRNMLQFV